MNQDQEKIKRRAYALWEQEGRPPGRDQAHWLRAEEEMDLRASLDEPEILESEGTTHATSLPKSKTAGRKPNVRRKA